MKESKEGCFEALLAESGADVFDWIEKSDVIRLRAIENPQRWVQTQAGNL